MSEKFSINKLLDFSPVGWYKVFGLALKGVVAVLLILGLLWVKNLLFPAAPANVNNPEITVEEGGQVTYNVTQKSKDERAWWIPSPFVEVFGEMDSDGDQEVGARAGARWNF